MSVLITVLLGSAALGANNGLETIESHVVIRRSIETESLFDPADDESDAVMVITAGPTSGQVSGDEAGSGESAEGAAYAWWDWSGSLGIPEGPDGAWVGVNCLEPNDVPGGTYVTSVQVHHEITHTYIGDLEVKLYNAETEHEWMVRQREGGSADNINETRTEYDIFDGDDPAQEWYYRVRDMAALDVGTLDVMQLYVYFDTQGPQLGEIYGTKWHDLDGNGVQDANEPGVMGWEIYLDSNFNGQWDTGEPNTVTDPNGGYAFTGLQAGTYMVAELERENWEQTYPAGDQMAPQQESLRGPILPITTTESKVPIRIFGEVLKSSVGQIAPMTAQSGSLINMDIFRSDPRFAGIDGSGYAAAILDTGIDLDHPYFGPDTDSDGVADRIVYHYDFADDDPNADDYNDHGSNVSSIVASEDSTYTGMAPAVDIIHLKVFRTSDGSGNFGYIEDALQWVVSNAAAYNIASVNMSLGDDENWDTAVQQYGVGDELAALAGMNVIVSSASGNDFYPSGSVQGVSYPAADPASLSIGAVYDSGSAGYSYESGAVAHSSGADRICPFSQRHTTLTTVFAPGAPITGANKNGSTVTMHGTSQASPHIAGIAVLVQQLAENELGRRLGLTEFGDLLSATGVTINDGDDEDDNVDNTGLDFPRVDMMALAEAILGLAQPQAHTVHLSTGQIVVGIDFGNRLITCGDWCYYEADFSQDCHVSPEDLLILADNWLECGCVLANAYCQGTDMQPRDGCVDMLDFAMFAAQWLNCTEPGDHTCDNLCQ